MGTSASITVKHSDGKYHGIYLGYDGYPEHTLRTLRKYYNSQELAEKLVSLGNLSSLDCSCEQPEGHTFNTPKDGFCVYYGRDRGEDGVNTTIKDTWNEVKNSIDTSYDYIFSNGFWDVIEN